MSKHSYREYFAEVKVYVKMKPFLKELNLSESNFSMFMKDAAFDCFMSLDNLEKLKVLISDRLQKIV